MLEWLTAIGTIAAAVVPLGLFLIERRDRVNAEAARDTAERQRDAAIQTFQAREIELAEQRDSEARESVARDQASKVHVWFDLVNGSPVFFFLNRSPAPVSLVQLDIVALFNRPGHVDSVQQRVLLGLRILPPTESVAERLDFGNLILFSDFDDPAPDWVIQSVVMIRAFALTDANGVDWFREFDGWKAGPLARFSGWSTDLMA